MKRHKILWQGVVIVCVARAVIGTAPAAVIDWADNGTDWGTGGNWVGGVTPGSSDTANFPADATIGNQPNVGASGADVLGLAFDNSQADYSLNGSGILTNRSGGLTVTGGGTLTINARIRLLASQTWNIGGAAVDVNGSMVWPGGVTITKTGSGTLTLNGPAQDQTFPPSNNWGQMLVNEGRVVINFSTQQNQGYGTSPGFVVGDGVGGAGADILDVHANKLISVTRIRVDSSGLVNILGSQAANIEVRTGSVVIASGATYTQQHDALQMVGGTVTVSSGGTLALNNKRVNTLPSGLTATLGGGGTVNLGTSASGWRVQDGAAAIDLDVPVVLSGSADLGLGNISYGFDSELHNGADAVIRLSGVNTYTGRTGIGSGTIWVNGDAPHGAPGVFGNATSRVILGQHALGVPVTVLIDGPYTVGRNFVITNSIANPTITLGGRTAQASSFTGDIEMLGLGLTVTAASGGTVTFSGNISQGTTARGVTKVGSGTVILSGNNSYSGATIVSNGTLLVNGTHSGAGAVSVVGGAKIGGVGTLTAALTLSGGATISPGTSPGTFTVGALTLQNNSIYDFELGDLIQVTGLLTLNDDWKLNMMGSGFQNGGTITLFTYGTLGASPDLAPTITWSGFTPSGPVTLIDTGSSIILQGVSAAIIPEPSTMMLLGVGGWAIWACRRGGGYRRKASS